MFTYVPGAWALDGKGLLWSEETRREWVEMLQRVLPPRTISKEEEEKVCRGVANDFRPVVEAKYKKAMYRMEAKAREWQRLPLIIHHTSY